MTRLVAASPVRFLPAQILPIDIATGFTNSDYISVALPDFDLVNIDLTQSYIDITSEPKGNFDLGPTASISFSSSVLPLIQGDSELKFPLALLTQIDKRALTGVRFRVFAINPTNFKVAAIRCVSQNWVWAPIDLDTLYHKIRMPVSPNGSSNIASNFPIANNLPFPIVWRSDHPSGPLDPRPIDSTMSMFFYTGSLGETGRDDNGQPSSYNEITMFFREAQETNHIQLDLSGHYTQAQLQSLGHQPDYGTSTLAQRPVSTLDRLHQSDLDSTPMSELDQMASTDVSVYIKVDLKWDRIGASLDIRDSIGNGYTLPNLQLNPLSYYMLRVTLEGTTMRVQCFPADYLGNITWTPVFDTNVITDGGTFRRRKGRFGWYASFADGDAYIGNIRTWGLNFAEYRSHAFRSNTPVRGAQIQVGGTLTKDLYDGITNGPWGGQISLDQTKSSSGKAIKIDNRATQPLSGPATVRMYFDDWKETTLHFNIFFPSSSKSAPIDLFMIGEDARIIQLVMPKFSYDKWQSIKIKLGTYCEHYQTGYYQLMWVQPNGTIPTIWWLDQIRVLTKASRWGARGRIEDAWQLVKEPFTPFEETINSDNSGVVFPRGTNLQVQGIARRQTARIDSIKILPQYASLGNFAWSDLKPALVQPTPSFTSAVSGFSVQFTDTSTDAGTPPGIIFRQWNFGDGVVDYGPTPTHIYSAHGTYSVSLQVINRQGQRNTTTQIITV